MDILDKSAILAEVWMSLRDDPQWVDFFTFNDAGLPLAFAVSEHLVEHLTEQGHEVIEESYSMLCQVLRLSPTDEYYDLGDMLSLSPGQRPLW